MPNYDFSCVCGNTVEAFMSFEQSRKGIKCVCGKMMKKAFLRPPAVKPDYLDIRHFGKPQYADMRRKQCGMHPEVPPEGNVR